MHVGVAIERGFQLFRQLRGLRIGSRRETANEACEARLGNLGREMDAGDPRSRKHAGKTLLGGGRIKRRAVEQQLIARGSQQQAGLIIGADRRAQFAPGSFVLSRCARVPEIIHPGKLE